MLEKLNDRQTGALVDAFVSLQSRDDCANFLEDLCTIGEIKSLAQRLEVARLLEEGLVYSEIAQRTGSSTATISRVKRCLDYGNGGYRTVLDALTEVKEK